VLAEEWVVTRNEFSMTVADLGSARPLTFDDVLRARESLKQNEVPRARDGYYRIVLAPHQAEAISIGVSLTSRRRLLDSLLWNARDARMVFGRTVQTPARVRRRLRRARLLLDREPATRRLIAVLDDALGAALGSASLRAAVRETELPYGSGLPVAHRGGAE
jgi:hypothetical protein